MARKGTNADKRADARYDEKRAGQRTRNWLAIFYPDDLPEDWKEQVDELQCRWIESPLHDKDLNPEDGTPKKPHCHTLFMFDSVKTQEQIETMLKGVLGESETGSILGVAIPKPCSDRCGSVRYMAHLDHPNKYQYDVSEIVGHNGADPAEILRYSATETREMIVAMEEYIERNNITELADFSKAIRYDHPEWHTIVATKMTVYFNAFIRSFRHKAGKSVHVVKVDENGLIVDNGK